MIKKKKGKTIQDNTPQKVEECTTRGQAHTEKRLWP